jgi:hypothetical protein
MQATSPFEITRRDLSVNAAAIFNEPAGFDPVPRGFALGAHATDPTQFDVAQHNTFIGHLTRFVRIGGLTLTDRTFGVTSETPVGVEAPFTAGQEVSIEKAKEIECEGSSYLAQSGIVGLPAAALASIPARTIQPNTPVGTGLNFYYGYLGIAQAGEMVNYKLTANGLPPYTAGTLRIRAEVVSP